jgi:CspA family cold shock protein
MNLIQRIKSLFIGHKGQTANNKWKKVGKIKFLNRSKGYGFIKSNQTANDVFMHFSDAMENLSAGDKVKFYVVKETKGLRAKEIELV